MTNPPLTPEEEQREQWRLRKIKNSLTTFIPFTEEEKK
jgi:hypothetical protein